MISVNSGDCMDVPGGSLASGVPLVQWPCGTPAQPNQTWLLTPSGSSYQLIRLFTGKCLDLPDGNSANGGQVRQSDCTQAVSQLWAVRPSSGPAAPVQNPVPGTYQIKPASNLAICSDVKGGSLANSAAIITFPCGSPAQPNQSWNLVPTQTSPGSAYQIISMNSGAYTDLTGGSQTPGTPVIQWICDFPTQSANRLWRFPPFGASYEIASVLTGKCIAQPAQIGGGLEERECAQGSDPDLLWNLTALTP